MRNWIEVSCTQVEGTRTPVRTAYSSILLASALAKTWRPGQTATPIRGVRDLPATNERIHQTARIASESLTFAERELKNNVGHPDVSTVLIIWPIRDRVADRVVGRI